MATASRPTTTVVYRRKSNLKAQFEGGLSYSSFKRSVPGNFNVGLIGSTCTGLPWQPALPSPAAPQGRGNNARHGFRV